MNRRRFLAATGLALSVTATGCLGDGPGQGDPTDTTTSDGTTTTEPGADPTTTEPDGGTTTPGTVDPEVLQVGPTLSAPRWDFDDSPGRVVFVDSRERAEAALPLWGDDERARALREFVESTAFDSAVLLYVQTVGPNTCYEEVAVEDIRIEGRTIRGSANARDTSEPGAGCGEAITYPAAVIRVPFGDSAPERATLTVTNGWDERAEITATPDDPLGPDPADLPGAVRPDGEPATVPAELTCEDEGFQRHATWVEDPPYGETADGDEPAFALRVEQTSLAYGETLTVHLTNVSDAVQYTGNRYKYGLEVKTEAGWQDVRGSTDGNPLAYTDEAVGHRPGEGFTWRLELTEDGLLDGHTHEDRMAVCPDLSAGRYRFVFWEPAVAVAFDLQR